MKHPVIVATLLLLPWLATAENGIIPLSQQQQFLNQRERQEQQQRILHNQQMEQRRQQQQYQLKMQQPKLLPDNVNSNPLLPMNANSPKMLPNGNQPLNPFE